MTKTSLDAIIKLPVDWQIAICRGRSLCGNSIMSSDILIMQQKQINNIVYRLHLIDDKLIYHNLILFKCDHTPVLVVWWGLLVLQSVPEWARHLLWDHPNSCKPE